MNYKDTLNLPKTDLPMKADLPHREPEMIERWDRLRIYDMVTRANSDGPRFILHDGPPYANGDIHLGTALNKILKDVIIKYKTLRGYHSPYVPGWDCHGQPIEHEVEKRLRGGGELDIIEVRHRCREYALDFVGRQSEQFRRLGVRGDFDNPYLTLRPRYEAENVRMFKTLFDKGLIYRGRKPVHWCPRCKTALAEAELEYAEHESPAVYVKFPLLEALPGLEGYAGRSYVVIWTTTPWTLPANVAIALHPAMKYLALKVADEILLVAEPLLEQALAGIGASSHETVGAWSGDELKGRLTRHPWRDRPSPLVLAEYVTSEQGTGAVHIAPGHGQEDYQVGVEYDLPVVMPVDDDGVFTAEAVEFAGLHVQDANSVIIEDLARRGLLLGASTLSHSYPHCWRCKGPVIFRATPQWFIAVDEPFEDRPGLRQAAIESVSGVNWVPEWNAKRMLGMLEFRPDWCISRQRAWGVPVPVFYCNDCGEELLTDASLERVAQVIEERGSDAWFELTEVELLGEGFRCDCGGSFRKGSDILDVWFESGISHKAVLTEWESLSWPADLYLEGSDQHRGWFQTSLLTSIASEGRPPFNTVLTHGFVVDGDGRKMSKSLGNVISPQEIVDKKYGADILRLWVAGADYSDDIPASDEIFSRTAEAYRRIRNTFRFLLGNLADFDAAANAVASGEMEEIDRWILSKAAALLHKLQDAYDRYQLHVVFHSVYGFCTVELSSLYLDMRKDCLYTFARDSRERRSAQTAMHGLTNILVKALSPILTFTTEEIWTHMEGLRDEDVPSIQLARWPEAPQRDEEVERRWEKLLEWRGRVTKALEERRAAGELGSSLQARVTIEAPAQQLEALRSVQEFLPTLFIISEALLREGAEESILIEEAPGAKCARCWNYLRSVGADAEHPELCERCLPVVRQISAPDA
ncbi:MAG: isoleucine--tRNA ligase [Candidatus Geothermincolia bacterium]